MGLGNDTVGARRWEDVVRFLAKSASKKRGNVGLALDPHVAMTMSENCLNAPILSQRIMDEPYTLQIARFSSCPTQSSPWLDIKVFYVRISNYKIDETTPFSLTLIHVPLGHETVVEVNGKRMTDNSDGISCVLRRNRVDTITEEATFVSTDTIRLTGTTRFEVYDRKSLIVSGVVEICDCVSKQWNLTCGKQVLLQGLRLPNIDVYAAGSFQATPLILTNTLQTTSRKKKSSLDSIPECQATESQIPEYLNHEEEFRDELMDVEDGELSLFNAGVRVGVGVGLGICVGLGLCVGLLLQTYRTPSRSFKKRFL